MKTVLISGATGYVGRFITEAFLRAGHRVIAMGRTPPPDGFFSRPVAWVFGALDPDQDFASAFADVDVFVHCAFNHVPGRYRGGEGNDPDGFWHANADGTLALMDVARQAGVSRAAFLSSRAVYGPQPAGVLLAEDMMCKPDTLYGEVKLAVEQTLAEMASEDFLPIMLRATGVYGPAGAGKTHKWAKLFEAFASGDAIAPRVGTEVHGDDLAAAAELLAGLPARKFRQFAPAPVFNVSDIMVDRHDLLSAYAATTSVEHPLPPRADDTAFNAMDGSRLRSLGWVPRGRLDLTALV